MSTLGIMGGSGIYRIPGLEVVARKEVETPYGSPSGAIIEGYLEGNRLLFLPRHGENHRIPPHRINYRANLCALKMSGAEQVVSLSAVGSMQEAFAPGDVVIVDQYIDLTKQRLSTFFDEGLVAHVSMADPVCPHLAAAAGAAAEAAGARVHRGGTYLCIEGPQFSSRAESLLYKNWGAAVIGMTAMPEAKLAREAQLPYATVAFVTDYDCWHHAEEDVSAGAVLEVLRKNAAMAQNLVSELPRLLPPASESPAARALQGAVITPDNGADQAARDRLAWLLDQETPADRPPHG